MRVSDISLNTLLGRFKRAILEDGRLSRPLSRRCSSEAVTKEGARSAGMPLTRRDVGVRGEELAAGYLERLGYRVVQRNFRCRQGELDIIARQGECLVFVEVRTKTSSDFGTPEESVTYFKKEKLISLANVYLQSLDSRPRSWRIDVVAVELTPDGKTLRLEHIENALD